MSEDSVQLKIQFPPHLHAHLQEEADQAGVTKASLVRLAVANRYPDAKPVSYKLTEKGKAQANGS